MTVCAVGYNLTRLLIVPSCHWLHSAWVRPESTAARLSSNWPRPVIWSRAKGLSHPIKIRGSLRDCSRPASTGTGRYRKFIHKWAVVASSIVYSLNPSIRTFNRTRRRNSKAIFKVGQFEDNGWCSCRVGTIHVLFLWVNAVTNMGFACLFFWIVFFVRPVFP